MQAPPPGIGAQNESAGIDRQLKFFLSLRWLLIADRCDKESVGMKRKSNFLLVLRCIKQKCGNREAIKLSSGTGASLRIGA